MCEELLDSVLTVLLRIENNGHLLVHVSVSDLLCFIFKFQSPVLFMESGILHLDVIQLVLDSLELGVGFFTLLEGCFTKTNNSTVVNNSKFVVNNSKGWKINQL